jgi:glycosyltransferase involved in cell wall biosynthesis
MASQTLLPIKWIIVNDGSTDDTEKIIKEFEQNLPFIECIRLPNRGHRKPAVGVIEAFYEGFKRVENLEYEIISKFDADLKFPPNTLEKICQAFKEDSRLGITGGTRYEQINETSSFKKVVVPKGFVGGPYKFYRKECYKDIKGLICRAGWDGVDIVKANMNGWRTSEIESLKIYHLKPTGTADGDGLIKASEKYGNATYYMGGYFLYFISKCLRRSVQMRSPKVAYYMMRGYLRSMLKQEERESKKFRIFLRKAQIENLKFWVRYIFSMGK